MNLSQLPKQFFVTGTDTEVGKTYCSALIVKSLKALGHEIFPFKPIAAGIDPSLASQDYHTSGHTTERRSVNEDAYELWLAVDKQFPLDVINPVLFEPAIAPHIAAELANTHLGIDTLEQLWQTIPKTEFTLVEGAGGWHLPLNNNELMSSWVIEQQMPIVLVVGIRLGCLNHALLTAESIVNSGGTLVGWIANFIEGEEPIGRQNVEYLSQKLASQYGCNKLFEVQKGQEALQ